MNKISAIGLAKGPVRLGRGRRLTVYLIASGVWLTGAGWLAFHYFLRTASEFGPTPNPLEPWWLKLHGLFAFGALWTLGLLSAAHIANGWATMRRRWSGVLLLSACVLMAVSGYLLYYLGDEKLRGVTSYVHWVLGLGGVSLLGWHRLPAVTPRSRRKRLDIARQAETTR